MDFSIVLPRLLLVTVALASPAAALGGVRAPLADDCAGEALFGKVTVAFDPPVVDPQSWADLGEGRAATASGFHVVDADAPPAGLTVLGGALAFVRLAGVVLPAQSWAATVECMTFGVDACARGTHCLDASWNTVCRATASATADVSPALRARVTASVESVAGAGCGSRLTVDVADPVSLDA